MKRTGYISGIVLDVSVNLTELARFQGVAVQTLTLNVMTAIADILSLAEYRERNGEVELAGTLADDERQRELDEHDGELTEAQCTELITLALGRSNCRFVINISIDSRRQVLVLNFADCEGDCGLPWLELDFATIRSGLQPYRDSIGRFGIGSFADSRNSLLRADLYRAVTHYDMLHSLGLMGDASAKMQFELAKKCGTLLSVLFPKGPHQDWWKQEQVPPVAECTSGGVLLTKTGELT
jgi:hypothetical protein